MQQRGDSPTRSYSDLALFIQSLVNDGRAAVAATDDYVGSEVVLLRA